MKFSRFAFVVAFVAATGLYAADQFGPWSAPVVVDVSVCNSSGVLIPAISKDGRSLYFTAFCVGGGTGTDLFVSQWDDSAATWGMPVSLWMLNTAANDQAPAFTRDGHFIYFVSTRPGGKGGQDIWMSYRAQTHDDFGWQPPVEVPELSTTDNEGGPALFQDDSGQQHMILQMRQGNPTADFYASDQMADGTWTTPVRIAELSSPYQDQRATIRFDGLEVIFESSRAGTPDLWFSTRETTSGMWSTPRQLPFNTDFYDGYPYLSGDGNTLYFFSNRDGTSKLWMSTRQRGKDKE